MKKVALHNLGCKVNSYETAHMEQLLKEEGYEIVSFGDEADIYIVNTCSVTNIADRKSRQMLHRAKKNNPKAIVIGCGCYVQTKTEEAKADEAIDIVVGNNRKKDIVAIVNKAIEEQNKGLDDTLDSVANVIDINHTDEYEDMDFATVTEHTRAHIKIQDGCNNFCSYCIIPYARGRVRSRNLDSIIKEARDLVALGYKELVITGIEVSSYDCNGKTLTDVIEKLALIDGLERIRLSSLNPDMVLEDFVKRISAIDKVCPHFHLSLQSGCDKVLKQMNRHYTTKEYKQKCDLLRKYFGDLAITTDIIVGFPDESEEDFETTMDFVREVGFSMLHVFKYSKRDGTVAAKMDNQVDEREKASRSEKLIALGKELEKEYLNRHLNKEVPVLFEEVKTDGYVVGHTPNYLMVKAKGDSELVGNIVDVKLVSLEDTNIVGEIL